MIKSKIYTDKSLRNSAIIFIIYFLFILFLILMGQNRLIKYEKNELLLESMAISSNIKLALESSKDSIDVLSNSNEIKSYFSNKALGMSLKYGLKANIIKIDNMFNTFVENKKIRNVQIFDSVHLFDSFNNEILENKKHSLLCNKLLKIIDGIYLKPKLFVIELDDKAEVYLVKTILTNNEKIGTLVARFNLSKVVNNFFFNPSIKKIAFIKINNSFFTIDDFKKIDYVYMFKDYISNDLENGKLSLIFNYQAKTSFLTLNIFLFLLWRPLKTSFRTSSFLFS